VELYISLSLILTDK